MKFFKKLTANPMTVKMPPAEKQRAFLIKVDTGQFTSNGTVLLTFEYLLINCRTGKISKMKECLSDNLNMIRTREFLDVLERGHVCFETFEDLVGTAFDVWLEYDIVDGKEYPVLNNKVVAALPPTYE